MKRVCCSRWLRKRIRPSFSKRTLMRQACSLGWVCPAVLAGVAALAAGWRFKFVLVVRASFNQGFSLPRVPVRGGK